MNFNLVIITKKNLIKNLRIFDLKLFLIKINPKPVKVIKTFIFLKGIEVNNPTIAGLIDIK